MYKNNYTNFLDNKNYVFIVLKSDTKRREHIKSLIKQNNVKNTIYLMRMVKISIQID